MNSKERVLAAIRHQKVDRLPIDFIARDEMIARLCDHYHCCGGLREIIPDLIEIGVDILNPVQPLARGMNLQELKQEFGDRLTFNGGIDTQELLPHKTGKEYEAEVRDILQFMGANGGFIMAPSHALQVDVPLENVIRLYEWTFCSCEQS